MSSSMPLDLRSVSKESRCGGKKETFPALHETWKQDVFFATYTSPVFLTESAAVDEWLEDAAGLEDDLAWLLRLSHHRFWSQLVYDETLQLTLDSYLKTCPRIRDDYLRLTETVHQKQLRLNELYFRIIMRMGTCKESQEFHITPEAFGNMLYNTYLLDIPKIMDICAIFGVENEGILSKMIANVFRHQPKYLDDLQIAAGYVHEAFESLKQRCSSWHDTGVPVPLKSDAVRHDGSSSAVSNAAGDSLVALSAAAFEDLLLYAFDVSYTLRTFLDVYPAGSKPFHESDFYSLLASVYETAVDALSKELARRKLSSYRFYTSRELQSRLRMMCGHLIAAFRCLLNQSCLQPLMDHRLQGNFDEASLVESYLGILSAAVAERRFLQCYNRSYPLDDDVDIFTQMGIKLDATRMQYIRSALADPEPAGRASAGKRKPAPSGTNAAAAAGAAAAVSDVSDRGNRDDEALSGGGAAAAIPSPLSDVELALLVSSVQDLLPELGDGFVEACLRHYGYSAEQVINAVFEDSLPSSLKSLDLSLPRQKLDTAVARVERPAAAGVLASRYNVHDNDEFDIFSRDHIDQNKVHKGKKSIRDNVPDQEKKELKDKIKALASQLDLLDVDELCSEVPSNLYEDEYDDTYDDHEVCADDVDSADELMGRPVVQPRVLAGPSRDTANDDSSDSEEAEQDAAAASFAVGAAPFQQQQQQQHRPHYDVKGRPRGRGQTGEVLHSRAFKERHKGRGANHNRKVMADRKRGRGMFS